MSVLLFILVELAVAAGVANGAVDFQANATSGVAPLTVQFTDATTLYRNIWNWDFGDGITDHARDPVHTFTSPGTYTVRVTEFADGSQIGSGSKTINVYASSAEAGGEQPGTGVPAVVSTGPGSVSVIPASVETPTPEAVTASPATATPQPASAASGQIGLFGGITLSEDAIQLALTAAIAIVIAGMVLYFFSNLNRHPGEKAVEKPRPPARSAKPEAKAKVKPPKPAAKKSDDISQDYIYGLVTGQSEKDREHPPAPPKNDFMKKL